MPRGVVSSGSYVISLSASGAASRYRRAGAEPMEPPVLIAHLVYRLDYGGLENGLINLVNRLSERRFRHAILCLAGYSDFRRRIARPDVEVVSVDKRDGKDPRFYLRVLGQLQRLRPDIVHTRNFATVDLQWLAVASGIRHRVHGEHGFNADDPEGLDPRSLRIRRACRPAIQRYVALSHDIAGWLERDVRVPHRRVRQVYNGVDTGVFRPDGGIPADLPWRDGPQGRVVIGTVGRLDRIKNQQALLEALRVLREHDRGAHRLRLVIAGDGPLRGELADTVRRLALDDAVWMPGSRADVPSLMRAMDVFVLPSRNEGVSNTVLEAMASGLPVIATRVGGNPELVADGVTGMLYDPGDEGALEAAILRYVAEPRLRREHGLAARRRAIEHFSLEAMVERYGQLYEELLGERSS
jgi:sugar transferase (PEP-CTERM/EpsH1 system associated)